MLAAAEVAPGDAVADVGAGVAHLTLMLAARGLAVTAVEPNDAMRANGRKRTEALGVTWVEGVGEATTLASGAYRLVTFGSSFNVTDRPKALAETARLLAPGGWFACMWNHRDLEDPLQKAIEAHISASVPGYAYGTRREDQTAIIDASGLFGPVRTIEGRVTHPQSVRDCVDAWRSHATLERQAGASFHPVVDGIQTLLDTNGQDPITVPYTTRIWVARRR